MYIFTVTIHYEHSKSTLNVSAKDDLDARTKAIKKDRPTEKVRYCEIVLVCRLD